MVGSSEVVVGHSCASNVGPKKGVTELELCFERKHVSVAPVTLGHSGARTWDQKKRQILLEESTLKVLQVKLRLPTYD